MEFSMCVPCLFGLEGLVSDELKRMGMNNVKAENGRVMFTGDKTDIAKSNICLRTGERVLIIIGQGEASTFDMLFELVRAMPWEQYVPSDGAFPVKGHTIGSKLHSVPDCQRIIKKAIVERLRSKYKTESLPETGSKYQVQFAIMNDIAVLYIDTSGTGLHKRGYRLKGNAAPLRETLAAAIVKLSRYRGRGMVCDPFCGSGTIAIESAYAALNRAPGLMRRFAGERFAWMDSGIWKSVREECKASEYRGDYNIWGGDIDPSSIKTAQENAQRAGVSDIVRFEVSDAAQFARSEPGGLILTNPPYGERVMERAEAEAIYRTFGATATKLDGWSIYIMSSHTEFERMFGKTASKKRKLYNGMIKCDLFMYF